MAFRGQHRRRVLFGGGTSTPTPPSGISDDFVGTNGTDLDGRELSSGNATWDVYRGGWDLQSNAARCHDVGVSGSNAAGADASLADCTVEMSLYFGARANNGLGDYVPTGFAGLYLRSKSDGSGIEVYLNGTDQKIEMFTNDGAGGRSAIAGGEVAFAFATETTYALKAILNGTGIAFYVDGDLKVSTTSTFNQAETRYGPWTWHTATDTSMPGFEVYGDSEHRFREFEVTA